MRKSLLKMNKRGILENFSNIAIQIAVLVVTMVVVFLLLANVGSNDDVVADGNASLAVDNLTTEAAGVVDWVGIAITVSIAVVILFLVRRIGSQK